MPKSLTPRSIAALAVVAASFFLMVSVAQFGGAFADPKATQAAGFAARWAGALVETLGAGVWVLLLLPTAWGVIVYFQERTPDLVLRLVGTVLLAVSTSTIAGLLHVGPWAGHVGNGVAGALGGLSARLGGFGTALAWTLALSLVSVSFIFATDWFFHALRRASRAAANEAPVIAEEPAVAELLVRPEEAQPREFVVDTPRAAVAAAEMADIVGETSDELVIPGGWDEVEDEGRTVISAPSGYRGVEFLPPSDELAMPGETPAPSRAPESSSSIPVLEEVVEDEPSFLDEQFVATEGAAFFLESPESIAAASEEPTEDFAPEASEDDAVAEAVETLFAAVTTPAPAPSPVSEPVIPGTHVARQGGIGLPEDSPFLDEFFALDAGWPYASEPGAASDGASAASEMASTFAAAAATPAPVPEPTPIPAPAPIPEPVAAAEPAFEDEVVSIDEILVSRIPAQAFDDEIRFANDTAEMFPSQAAFASETPTVAPSSFEPSAAAESSVAVMEAVLIVESPAIAAAPQADAPAVAAPVVPAPAFVLEPEVALPVVVEPQVAPPVVVEAQIASPVEAAVASPVAVEVAAPVVVETPVGVPVYAAAEPSPQLTLFADPSPAVETPAAAPAAVVAPRPELDLSRLHAMELDPLFHDAVNAVLERGRASAVVLQRQLGIGYARGIRILDQMTAGGLVGPDSPTGTREMRVTREQWASFVG